MLRLISAASVLALTVTAGAAAAQDFRSLARQDLPPETVDNNLAWLRGATSAPAGAGRSWEGVRAAQP